MAIMCDRCGVREAQYFRVSSGERLCLNCLFSLIEDTVARTIRRYRLISSGDRIGIAISGGKDSLVLTYLLGKLRKHGRIPKDVELIAFSIDEGQPYSCVRRSNAGDFVSKLTGEFNIEYRLFTFKELFGVTAFDVAQGLWGKGINVHMCTICGVLRRRAMNIIGRVLNLSKIATGHNLDDEAQTVVLNVMGNDIKRFAWFGITPSNDVAEEEFIPRIKPLRFIREEEVAI
ncbi:MAG: tRNA 2-thiocytidine biosynthesis TtcA family protein, partial [Caldivirga sp.]